jgi:hypothetical protein
LRSPTATLLGAPESGKLGATTNGAAETGLADVVVAVEDAAPLGSALETAL